jgi:hypothetical protein
MDTTQDEKIYVAVGYDVVDGFQTLEWALKKWNSHPNISIIILHVKYNTSNDHVYTLRKFLTYLCPKFYSSLLPFQLNWVKFHLYFVILLQLENSLQKVHVKKN